VAGSLGFRRAAGLAPAVPVRHAEETQMAIIPRRWTRRGFLAAGAGLAFLLPACNMENIWDGHLNILGYTTRPNYDLGIKTVRLPIFENKTFYQGLEFEVTNAVIHAIESRTPYKIVSNANAPADTELKGVITLFTQNSILPNPNNERRLVQSTMNVEVTWVDLRTGKALSGQARRAFEPIPTEQLPRPEGLGPLANMGIITPPTRPGGVAIDVNPPPPGQPEPLDPAARPKPKPVQLTATAQYIPELGGSMAVGVQQCAERMALNLVNMMEVPW
jgi:hypothetical protein